MANIVEERRKGDIECLMTIQDFFSCVRDGAISDYDGHGYYSKDEVHLDECVDIEEIEKNYHQLKKVYNYVFWYNK